MNMNLWLGGFPALMRHAWMSQIDLLWRHGVWRSCVKNDTKKVASTERVTTTLVGLMNLEEHAIDEELRRHEKFTKKEGKRWAMSGESLLPLTRIGRMAGKCKVCTWKNLPIHEGDSCSNEKKSIVPLPIITQEWRGDICGKRTGWWMVWSMDACPISRSWEREICSQTKKASWISFLTFLQVLHIWSMLAFRIRKQYIFLQTAVKLACSIVTSAQFT